MIATRVLRRSCSCGVTLASVVAMLCVWDQAHAACNVPGVGNVTIDLKSIEFTSDHEDGNGDNILLANNTDWTDDGTAYGEPEWVSGSHTRNSKLTVKITISVSPANLTFDLEGDGPNNYVDFHKNGNTSTGADQEITVTADGNLPGAVCILTESINWKINVNGTECNAGSSGEHTIYVTWGTPAPSSDLTHKRIEWCTTVPFDTDTPSELALEIANKVNVDVVLGNGNTWPTPYSGNIWPALEKTEANKVDCLQSAALAVDALKLLGYPSADVETGMAWPSSDTNVDTEEPTKSCPTHGTLCLRYEVENGGYLNNYEGYFKINYSSSWHYYTTWADWLQVTGPHSSSYDLLDYIRDQAEADSAMDFGQYWSYPYTGTLRYKDPDTWPDEVTLP